MAPTHELLRAAQKHLAVLAGGRRVPSLERVDSRVAGDNALVLKGRVCIRKSGQHVRIDEMKGAKTFVPKDFGFLLHDLPIRNKHGDHVGLVHQSNTASWLKVVAEERQALVAVCLYWSILLKTKQSRGLRSVVILFDVQCLRRRTTKRSKFRLPRMLGVLASLGHVRLLTIYEVLDSTVRKLCRNFLMILRRPVWKWLHRPQLLELNRIQRCSSITNCSASKVVCPSSHSKTPLELHNLIFVWKHPDGVVSKMTVDRNCTLEYLAFFGRTRLLIFSRRRRWHGRNHSSSLCSKGNSKIL